MDRLASLLGVALIGAAVVPTAVVAAPITIVVTSTLDVDGKCTAAQCTLRQAINDSNKNVGRDTIRFAIPGDTVPHTIRPSKELPPIKDAAVIDGSTEPSVAVVGHLVVEIDGSSAPAGAVGLRISGTGSEIRGLVINRFGSRGSSTSGASGIVLDKGGSHVIEGNYIGTDIVGHADRGNRIAGVSVQRSSDNRIGGTSPSQRNLISGNGTGIVIDGVGGVATRNSITGNYIGVDAEGDNKLGNDIGVDISQAAGNFVGGSAAGAANVISANAGAGVEIRGSGSRRNVVAGNLIGTDATGTANFGNFRGVFFTAGALENTVGGDTAGAGNVIAFNSETGVLVPDITGGRSVQIRIIGNSIHSNGIPGLTGLGIDLTPQAGVTPNDLTDADLGGNRLMNFPVLMSAVSDGSGTAIQGTLGTEAARAFRVELFVGPTCDGNGHGEGATFIGATTVSTNASGAASFSFSTSTQVTLGWFATATSTEEQFGNTSEFSACRVITGPPDPPSWTVNTDTDVTDSSGCTVSHCSLREAMLRANSVAGRDTISFDIPDSIDTAPHVITPLSPLPAQTQSVVIDGTTEPDFVDSPVIQVDGITAGPSAVGFTLGGTSSVVRGLSVTRFTNAQIVVSADNGLVAGNWIGIKPDGSGADRAPGTGVRLTAADSDVGGITEADRNVISGHSDYQIHVLGGGAHGNVILGNLIGTRPDGSRDPSADSYGGIHIENADNNVIGDTSTDGGNRIRAVASNGIWLEGSSFTSIHHNDLARHAEGGGFNHTIVIDGGTDTRLGGLGPREGNLISGASGMGVLITSGVRHVVLGNSMGPNAEQSIDLGPYDSVNLDDLRDTDTGPNGLQNYPDLTSAVLQGDVIEVTGTLNTTPGSEIGIDLYATHQGGGGRCHGASRDIDGVHRYFGDLDSWIGHGPTQYQADANGDLDFSFTTTPGAVAGGPVWVMATATGPEGTSEGSACVLVTDPAAFVQADGTALSLRGEPWYLYGASIYHAAVPGGSGSLSQVTDWAQEAGLNTIRMVNYLDERGIVADAPYSEADWHRVDGIMANLAAADLHVILDLSVFRNHLVNHAVREAGLVANCVPGGDRTPVDYAALSPYRADLADEWSAWMSFVANRVNTFTGVAYRDDPNIALVSIAGEPGPPNSEECGMAASTAELTAFYSRTMGEWQDLDTNHLVSNGGFMHLDWEELYGNPFGSGIDWQAIFSDPANDVPSIHSYVNYPIPMDDPPVPFTEYQTAKIAPFVAALGKPWITEEFGFPQRDPDPGRAVYYQAIYDLQTDYGSAGVAFWNLGHEIGPGTFDVNPGTPAVWQVVKDNAP